VIEAFVNNSALRLAKLLNIRNDIGLCHDELNFFCFALEAHVCYYTFREIPLFYSNYQNRLHLGFFTDTRLFLTNPQFMILAEIMFIFLWSCQVY